MNVSPHASSLQSASCVMWWCSWGRWPTTLCFIDSTTPEISSKPWANSCSRSALLLPTCPLFVFSQYSSPGCAVRFCSQWHVFRWLCYFNTDIPPFALLSVTFFLFPIFFLLRFCRSPLTMMQMLLWSKRTWKWCQTLSCIGFASSMHPSAPTNLNPVSCLTLGSSTTSQSCWPHLKTM